MLNAGLEDVVAKLSLDEKAALRVLIDLPGKSLGAAEEKFFGLHPWTGVILFPKNVERGVQVKELIDRLQAVNSSRFPDYPLFISVDQEGGSVSPLEGLITPSPGNMALAASGDEEAVYAMARQNGKELRTLGFNVNFSPVVDVNINPANPIIGVRSFGESPEAVGRLGALAIRGYQDEGVMATAKHFPGHGDTAKDSHLDLPVVRAGLERLQRVELSPFREAVRAGVWGMMTAHVIFPEISSKPATLSRKFLTGILRDEMGFDGIIFTDSFAMAAIKEHFSLEQAVLDSVLAGADVLLALGDAGSQIETFRILRSLIESGKIPAECVNKPLERILAFRKRLGEFRRAASTPPPVDSKALHAKCVTLLSGKSRLPLKVDGKRIFLSPEATEKLGVFRKHFSEAVFVPWPWLEKPANASWLFFAEKRLLLPDAELKLKEWNSAFECAAALGNPYHLSLAPRSEVNLTTYHFNEIFVESVRNVLIDGKPAGGKPPVALG